MQVTVKKWGNSAAVRIPSSLMRDIGLDLDDPVSLRVEDGRIVIEKSTPCWDLAAMLKGITPKNLHGAVETGDPVGKEIW